MQHSLLLGFSHACPKTLHLSDNYSESKNHCNQIIKTNPSSQMWFIHSSLLHLQTLSAVCDVASLFLAPPPPHLSSLTRAL